MDRKELHRLVEDLPDEKLPRMEEFFCYLFDEDELELNAARKRIKSGDYSRKPLC